MFAATFREYGGPEVMRWEELDDPSPASGEVLIRVLACGLNHSDLDSRAGTSRWPFTMPWVLGAEFAGTVAEVGDAVDGVAVGDPVTAYQQYACGACKACERWRPDLCERFVVFGAMLAYSLAQCGLRTSSVGAYAAPEPIPYTGMPVG